MAGENAMKKYFETHSAWLGGEFYAASNEDFEIAWRNPKERSINALMGEVPPHLLVRYGYVIKANKWEWRRYSP